MTPTIMERTRTRLLLDQPFFGSLAMELAMVEDTAVPVASTDGKQLKWNPAVWEGLSTDDRKFVLAHEVMHCALLHPWRTSGMDQAVSNQAADYVVNDLLKSAGFDLMKGVLYDPRFDGMSMEQVYSKLMSERQPDDKGDEPGGDSGGDEEGESGDSGDDEGDSGQSTPGKGSKTSPGSGKPASQGDNSSPTGDFVPAPTPEPGEESGEQHWKLAAEGVMQVCKSAGFLPGDAADAIKAAREPKVDWKEETREWLSAAAEKSPTWTRPNRRFVADNLYLPGRKREGVGRLIVAVDCSGSCWSILPKFTAGVQGLLSEAQPESVAVVYWDTKIQGVEEFDADDVDIQLQAKGGGGTMFGPVLDKIEEESLEPVGMIVLTDMYIGDLGTIKEPVYPVLWVTPEFSTDNGPFGRTIRLNEGE